MSEGSNTPSEGSSSLKGFAKSKWAELKKKSFGSEYHE